MVFYSTVNKPSSILYLLVWVYLSSGFLVRMWFSTTFWCWTGGFLLHRKIECEKIVLCGKRIVWYNGAITPLSQAVQVFRMVSAGVILPVNETTGSLSCAPPAYLYLGNRDVILSRVDFILCIGGDGTILYTASLFQVYCTHHVSSILELWPYCDRMYSLLCIYINSVTTVCEWEIPLLQSSNLQQLCNSIHLAKKTPLTLQLACIHSLISPPPSCKSLVRRLKQ